MFTLNPGPSQISDATKEDIVSAIRDGILEISHRSTKFTEISRRCIEELRAFLHIPSDYHVFYFDSATHLWHSLAANLVEHTSFHFVNGSFSGKAREASAALGKTALTSEVPWGEQCDYRNTKIPRDAELITACYNETSTGVQMLEDEVTQLRKNNSDSLLAIDVTSCAGGIPLHIDTADVWYFSVQKCFGLPAGLAIAVVSERAYARSCELGKKGANLAGIWSWDKLEKMMANDLFQTPHTPNILNIYLLAAQCQRHNKAGGISPLYEKIKDKKEMLEQWMRGRNGCAFFVQDAKHRSQTVFTIGASEESIKKAKDVCKEKGITLGSGYGNIKRDTFRIANFPAVTGEMISETLRVLETVFS